MEYNKGIPCSRGCIYTEFYPKHSALMTVMNKELYCRVLMEVLNHHQLNKTKFSNSIVLWNIKLIPVSLGISFCKASVSGN